MGFVNDAIIKHVLAEQVSVSSDYETEAFDISGAESGFSIVVALDNGSTPDISFSLLVSTDGQNFGEIADSIRQFTDTDGSITWDVISSQVSYVKVSAVVASGSIDITSAILSAKRRH